MDEKKIYLTEEGLNELKKELDFLKLEKRPEIINALKDARALGDLSENAEYDAARSEQATTEARIKELEKMLENVEIISDVKTDSVALGTKVKLEYVGDDETDEYSIVGSKEADPFLNKISNESPIAQAILESGWGKSAIGNNLFGIKADSSWSGEYVECGTKEYDGGGAYSTTAKFRAYSNWGESVEDHGKFLKDNSRYAKAGLFSAKDYIGQAYALKSAGYATDPNYPMMLIELIQKYGLNQYDNK